MPTVTISDVELLAPRESAGLVGFQLQQPTVGSRDAYAISFEGWVLAHDVPTVALELSARGYRSRLPVGLPRNDLAEAHPDLPHARLHSGFRVAASIMGLPAQFKLRVTAVLADDRRIPLARVHGYRQPLPEEGTSMQPLLVTSLGRTGTTWVMDLVSRHPDVIAHDVWKGEIKVAAYWAEILAMLGRPASYLQAITADLRGGQWYVGTNRLFDERVDDAATEDWLGKNQVEAAARFCRERIEAFYEREQSLQGKKHARYFAEKSLPRTPAYADVLKELFPGLREVFLVRDFRDMLASIFAYNARMGQLSFQRDLADSDEEYVRKFLGRDLSTLLRGWRHRGDRAFLVRYEDLALNPEETLTALLGYLDLHADGPVLDRILAGPGEASKAKERQHRTSASLTESMGRWRKDLDPELIAVCEDVFGEALLEFGYLGAPVATAGADVIPEA